MTQLDVKQVDRKTRDLNMSASQLIDYFTDRAFAMWPLGNVLPVSTDALTNVVRTPNSNLYCRNINAQTLLAPTTVATGLSIAGDLTATDGFDIGLNEPNQANSRFVFTVGSEPVGFYIEARFTIADVSGVAELLLGFRKLGASAAARSSYTDYAYAAIIGSAIETATRLNSGSEALVDSTNDIADTNAITLRVEVDSAGKVSFFTSYDLVAGALDTSGKLYAPKVSQTFTFDSGDMVVPNIRFIHDTDVVDTLVMNYLKCGYLN